MMSQAFSAWGCEHSFCLWSSSNPGHPQGILLPRAPGSAGQRKAPCRFPSGWDCWKQNVEQLGVEGGQGWQHVPCHRSRPRAGAAGGWPGVQPCSASPWKAKLENNHTGHCQEQADVWVSIHPSFHPSFHSSIQAGLLVLGELHPPPCHLSLIVPWLMFAGEVLRCRSAQCSMCSHPAASDAVSPSPAPLVAHPAPPSHCAVPLPGPSHALKWKG